MYVFRDPEDLTNCRPWGYQSWINIPTRQWVKLCDSFFLRLFLCDDGLFLFYWFSFWFSPGSWAFVVIFGIILRSNIICSLLDMFTLYKCTSIYWPSEAPKPSGSVGGLSPPIGTANFRFHRPATPAAPWSALRQGWCRFV